MPILGCSPLSTFYLVPPRFLNFKGNWGGCQGQGKEPAGVEWGRAAVPTPQGA